MDYNIIYTTKEIHAYIGDAGIVAFDFETAPDDKWRDEPKAALDAHKAHIVGISLSVKECSAVYIPLSHKVGVNANDHAGVLEYLREAVFENPRVVKVAHNLSFEAMFLYALGIVVCEPCYDTIAAAQLMLKSKFEFRNLSDSGLKLLSTSLFGTEYIQSFAIAGLIRGGSFKAPSLGVHIWLNKRLSQAPIININKTYLTQYQVSWPPHEMKEPVMIQLKRYMAISILLLGNRQKSKDTI